MKHRNLNSSVVQMNGTTYFHVGIWCVLEIGRSPGLSSTLLTPSRPWTVVYVVRSDLQLRDSDGFSPFFPFKPNRSLAPTLTRYVIFITIPYRFYKRTDFSEIYS